MRRLAGVALVMSILGGCFAGPAGGDSLSPEVSRWCADHQDDVWALARELGRTVVLSSPSDARGGSIEAIDGVADVCRQAYAARSQTSPGPSAPEAGIPGDLSVPGPRTSSPSAVATPAPSAWGTTATPRSIPIAPAVLTVMIDEWSARCIEVERVDCIGASERFINLLAWSTYAVFDESGSLLNVEPRPVCPAVPHWADGSYCWQVTAEGATLSPGEPWCMVIAKRSTDTRYPPYVQVGGPDGTGRAGGMPESWPLCN
jgi:hypothetical protein